MKYIEIGGKPYVIEENGKVYAADNPYWLRVCDIARKQREKGIDTYGMGLEMNPMEITKRITYLEEELVDALMYCEWIKDAIKECDIR